MAKSKTNSSPVIDELRKQLPKVERRFLAGTDGAIAFRSDGGGNPVIAMSIPFNRRSSQLGNFVEVIQPGAFRKTLQESDVVALWNHDASWVLGRMSNQTLVAQEADQALEGSVTLDGQDPMHMHFARRCQRRDVQGSSFGFETVRDEWVTEPDGTVLRTLVEVRLYDLSPVTFPAYPDSSAEARSNVLDVASVRSGVDLAAITAALTAAENGKIAAEAAEAVRSQVDRIIAMLPAPSAPPPPAVSDEDRRQRLAGLARIARLA